MYAFLHTHILFILQVLIGIVLVLSIANFLIGYRVFNMLTTLNKRQRRRIEAERVPSFNDFYEGWERVDEFNGRSLMTAWSVLIVLMGVGLLSCFYAIMYLITGS